LFSEVQTLFSPDEAEVYKQGNRLVIRLRGIQFPVGKAFILPSNYALLSKIQRAIRTFGEPDVVIEGHTDSTGSDVLNQNLSQRRAEAVREYFVANGTLTYEAISAVGYGSEQPLASNKTAEGRAINRRIDVVISPRLQKMK
jgi:outer membrane protein OmpA-like peptidoglycan-associated protein